MTGEATYAEVSKNRFQLLQQLEDNEEEEFEDQEIAPSDKTTTKSKSLEKRQKTVKGNKKFHSDPHDINELDNLTDLMNACRTGTPHKPEAQKKVYQRSGNTFMNTKPSTSTDNGVTNENNTLKMIGKIIIKGLTMYLNGKRLNEIMVGLVDDIFALIQ